MAYPDASAKYRRGKQMSGHSICRVLVAAAVIICFHSSASAQTVVAEGNSIRTTGNSSTNALSTVLSESQLKELKEILASGNAERTQEQRQLIQVLRDRLSISEAQIAHAFAVMGTKDVPPAQMGEKLVEFAQKYIAIKAELDRVSERYPRFKVIRATASDLIDSGKFAEARALIQKELAATSDARLEAAELTALQGMTASLEFRYGEAAALYQAATVLAGADPEASTRYTLLQVRDLLHGSDEHTRRDYVADAVRALEKAQANPGLAGFPDLAKDVEHKLAIALVQDFNMRQGAETFGKAKAAFERLINGSNPGTDDWRIATSGLAALYTLAEDPEAAIPLYRKLIEHGIAVGSEEERVVFANLAGALATIGYAEDDVAMLEEAKKYAEKAVAAGANLDSRQKSLLRFNLGNTTFFLGSVSKNTKMLSEAEGHFKDALGYVTKTVDPLSWASTNRHLGVTLRELARLAPSDASYGQAIEYFDAALTVWKRDEPLHLWHDTQLLKARAMVEWASASPNEKRLTDAIRLLNDMKKGLDEDDDVIKIVDIEVLTGDAYSQLWFQTRREPARRSARKNYEKANSRAVVNLFDPAALAAGAAQHKEVTEKLRKLNLPAKAVQNKKAKK